MFKSFLYFRTLVQQRRRRQAGVMMVMSMDVKRTAASEQRLHTPSVTVLHWVLERGCGILVLSGFRTKSKLGLYAALNRKG
jgi:uncharacterized membrane protein YphA (DoxX/SURF4 family)